MCFNDTGAIPVSGAASMSPVLLAKSTIVPS
jgi:hypothetical protein